MKPALVIAFYALAMAYLKSVAVVYLQRALSISPSTLIPLRDQATLGGLASIEVGREVATIVMLAAIGWLAGRSSLERLAWTSVAFGIWDIGYYFWLLLIVGGLVVVLSFTLDAGNIRRGGMPASFAWPVFSAGMVIAVCGVASVLRRK